MVERIHRIKKNAPKRILRDFKMFEISCVDFPAQVGAKMAIMKRDSSQLSETIAKRYIDPQDGAVSFENVLQRNLEDDRYYEVMREVGPSISALETSLRSIAGDDKLSPATKKEMMQSSANAFFTAIRERWPEVETAMSDAYSGVVKTTDEQERLSALSEKAEELKSKILKLKVENLQKRISAAAAGQTL